MKENDNNQGADFQPTKTSEIGNEKKEKFISRLILAKKSEIQNSFGFFIKLLEFLWFFWIYSFWSYMINLDYLATIVIIFCKRVHCSNNLEHIN